MAEETPVAESSGGGGNRLLTVIVLIQLAAICVLYYMLFDLKAGVNLISDVSSAKAEKQEEMSKNNAELTLEERDEKGMGPVIDLGGQIIVNLRGLDGRSRLLRTNLQIEVDSEETRREVESKIIMIRYKLTRLLSARRPDEVIGPNQMEQVRDSMKRAADAVLKSQGKVINVWPSDWILE